MILRRAVGNEGFNESIVCVRLNDVGKESNDKTYYVADTNSTHIINDSNKTHIKTGSKETHTMELTTIAYAVDTNKSIQLSFQ